MSDVSDEVLSIALSLSILMAAILVRLALVPGVQMCLYYLCCCFCCFRRPAFGETLLDSRKRQRRAALEKVLVCKSYSKKSSPTESPTKSTEPDDNNDIEAGKCLMESDDCDDVEKSKLMNKQNVIPDVTCVICLEDYEDGDLTIQGNYCSHIFHKDCIFEWLDNHDVCPCCRVDMMKNLEIT